ncbi:hypothetical protein SO694_00075184 [Aureococcus anophagefferens]|uniref:Photosystem II 12 kDa extrinsic protein n=1 Tax=Aureococcus anophagefferens TaxID=44056 RepID=A0ABR1FHD0_AURAN
MRAFLALMVSGAGALSMTRRGVAARVGVAVTTGEFLRTRDARAAYDYDVESSGVGADRNAVDARSRSRCATVTEYKQFAGMYPSVAGKIASPRPYGSIGDVRKLANFSPTEAKIFKANQKEFTVLPPGRMFIERINQRQSL